MSVFIEPIHSIIGSDIVIGAFRLNDSDNISNNTDDSIDPTQKTRDRVAGVAFLTSVSALVLLGPPAVPYIVSGFTIVHSCYFVSYFSGIDVERATYIGITASVLATVIRRFC